MQSDTTDREWALIAPLLPGARPGGRPRTTCLRRVVDAIVYRGTRRTRVAQAVVCDAPEIVGRGIGANSVLD